MKLHFILGGARSGKSGLAERLADFLGKNVCYIATATAFDEEMRTRIVRHKEQRPSHWACLEEPVRLAQAISQGFELSDIVLVDCLTLWLSNLLFAEDTEQLDAEKQSFLSLISDLKGSHAGKHLILVSNETNMGVIPLEKLTRQYCDLAGWLHQDIAKLSDAAILAVAGLPHVLKGNWPAEIV
ncbi:bifunctional adenosylcobinamide kinase/adenosylcobinamide-phosphate guanylyltransferase [Sneathiella sp.]|jgi:adenosylcobinamide kinase/adenosylcobinamide-phosphate guanylyltransferase|uniref:bifunctional adenosylcobinamide kinase/adenosylcobinamide-phosphate guanylyltransferase n=1 Tax=Sneathiella sp. TaxID=1964365 RepID=UPI0039E5662F